MISEAEQYKGMIAYEMEATQISDVEFKVMVIRMFKDPKGKMGDLMTS